MSLTESKLVLLHVPVGLTRTVVDDINMVADVIIDIGYTDSSNPSYICERSVNDEWTQVNMYVTYYIEECMDIMFKKFIKNKVSKLDKDQMSLQKCWSITNEEC